jgi:hypothetical protein
MGPYGWLTRRAVVARLARGEYPSIPRIMLVLVIKTVTGAEIRIPLAELESITEIEPPPHAYIHRDGVNRCAACLRPRTHRSHTGQAVHS